MLRRSGFYRPYLFRVPVYKVLYSRSVTNNGLIQRISLNLILTLKIFLLVLCTFPSSSTLMKKNWTTPSSFCGIIRKSSRMTHHFFMFYFPTLSTKLNISINLKKLFNTRKSSPISYSLDLIWDLFHCKNRLRIRAVISVVSVRND